MDSKRNSTSANKIPSTDKLDAKKIDATKLIPFLEGPSFSRMFRVHTNVSLGDLVELSAVTTEMDLEHSELCIQLEKSLTLSQAISDVRIGDKDRFIKLIASRHNLSVEMANDLKFFPSANEVERVLLVLSESMSNPSINTMMFCAAAQGRTGLFLALFIARLMNCSFLTACDVLRDQEFIYQGEVEYYSDYVGKTFGI